MHGPEKTVLLNVDISSKIESANSMDTLVYCHRVRADHCTFTDTNIARSGEKFVPWPVEKLDVNTVDVMRYLKIIPIHNVLSYGAI